MVGDQPILLGPDVMHVAGPRIIPRAGRQAIAHRVELDVAADGQQVELGVDDGGAVTPLPQRAAASMLLVEIRDVVTSDPLHHPCQALIVGRRSQQVQVIRHEHIGMDGHLELPCSLLEPAEEGQMVIGITEDGQAVMATLDDVVRLVRNDESGKAGHGRRCKPVEWSRHSNALRPQ